MKEKEVKETEEQKPKKKFKKWIWALVAVFVIIVIASAGGGGDDGKESTGSEAEPEQMVTASTWATDDVTEDNIRKALSGKAPVDTVLKDSEFPKNISSIEIVDNANIEGHKNVMLHYTSGTVWDETDLVKKAGGTAIIAGSILFNNPKIETVGLFTETEMTDQYGNTEQEVVIKIVLTCEIANKINWEGIADRHITDPGNIYRIADNYFIHPGVLKNLKLDEVQIQ